MHTLCAGRPESDDRGNNISVKRLGTSLDRCIERYIKNRIIIRGGKGKGHFDILIGALVKVKSALFLCKKGHFSVLQTMGGGHCAGPPGTTPLLNIPNIFSSPAI